MERPSLVLKRLTRRGRWKVGYDGVTSIELVMKPSRRWGFTSACPVRCRVRFAGGRSRWV